MLKALRHIVPALELLASIPHFVVQMLRRPTTARHPASESRSGEVKMVASPINYSRSKSDDIKAPQQLGESTDKILTDYLEYSSLEIDSLRERFII